MTVKSGGGRPKVYKTADGKRVPGVTTIVNRFKDSGGLIHWAWQQGADGLDYRQTKEAAADAGSIAHELIDANIHDRDPVIESNDFELIALARKGFDGFLRWRERSRLDIFLTETPFISERYRFGGTLDGMGRTESGALVLIDWKSSNRIYADYLSQTGAYVLLWEENNPGEPITGIELLRVGKEYGDFHHHSWPREVLDIGAQAFLLARQLYDLDAPLKRAVG